MITDEQIAAAQTTVTEAIRNSWGQPSKRQPQSNNASKCGHPCPFYLWACRVRWEEFPVPDQGLMGIFKNGRDLQKQVTVDLLTEGWDCTGENIRFRDEDLDITGRLDFYLSHPDAPDGTLWAKPVPCEVKGFHPGYFDSIRSLDDMLHHGKKWVRLAPYQALWYGFMAPEERPYVSLLIRDKSSRETRCFVMEVEKYWHLLEQVESVLVQVNEGMRTGEPPPALRYDPLWCQGCDAESMCPTMQYRGDNGDTIAVDDEAFDALCAEFLETKDATKRNGKIKDELKLRARYYKRYDGDPGEIKIAVMQNHTIIVKHQKSRCVMEVEPNVVSG